MRQPSLRHFPISRASSLKFEERLGLYVVKGAQEWGHGEHGFPLELGQDLVVLIQQSPLDGQRLLLFGRVLELLHKFQRQIFASLPEPVGLIHDNQRIF